jgi:hypothetical protein
MPTSWDEDGHTSSDASRIVTAATRSAAFPAEAGLPLAQLVALPPLLQVPNASRDG